MKTHLSLVQRSPRCSSTRDRVKTAQSNDQAATEVLKTFVRVEHRSSEYPEHDSAHITIKQR